MPQAPAAYSVINTGRGLRPMSFITSFAGIDARMDFSFSLVLLLSAASQINAAVKVTYYYESLCKDCVVFIRDQMLPTYTALRDHLQMDFVPFGKANWTENPWSITCQHGPRECHGNAIQACALERYKIPEMQINFVHCVMIAPKPDEAGAECAKKLGYDYRGIAECAVGKEGQSLHIKHGTRTKALKPPLTRIPTFAFNDKYSPEEQAEAEKDFKKVVCSKFPADQRPPGCGKANASDDEGF